MITPYISHDEATAKSLRNNPSVAAEYLNSLLADGSQQELMLAFRRIADAFGMKLRTGECLKRGSPKLSRIAGEGANSMLTK